MEKKVVSSGRTEGEGKRKKDATSRRQAHSGIWPPPAVAAYTCRHCSRAYVWESQLKVSAVPRVFTRRDSMEDRRTDGGLGKRPRRRRRQGCEWFLPGREENPNGPGRKSKRGDWACLQCLRWSTNERTTIRKLLSLADLVPGPELTTQAKRFGVIRFGMPGRLSIEGTFIASTPWSAERWAEQPWAERRHVPTRTGVYTGADILLLNLLKSSQEGHRNAAQGRPANSAGPLVKARGCSRCVGASNPIVSLSKGITITRFLSLETQKPY